MKYILLISLFSLFYIACESSNGVTFGTNDIISLPKVQCTELDTSLGWHVTEWGSPEGDGSENNPWDLDTALRHPSVVLPGDTIWIHGGTYTGIFVAKLDGEENNPILVSAVPGERVTIDGNGAETTIFQIYHSFAVFRGFEITDTNTDRRNDRASGIWVGGDHIYIQNFIVHDVGVGISGGQVDNDVQAGTNVELYGSIFYNNGWLGTDRGHGHHLYLTNRDYSMTISENILFSAYGFGGHLYSETDRNWVQGFDLVGNIWFLNGAPGGKLTDGCLVGHNESRAVSSLTLRENFGWNPSYNDRSVRLGYGAPVNNDVQLYDNYIYGQMVFQQEWKAVRMSGNTFIGSVSGVDTTDYPENAYISETPQTNAVFFRENRYSPGRFHVIVYNYEGLSSVNIDMGSLIPVDTAFKVINVQDYFGSPVIESIYDGNSITIPMENLNEVAPYGETDELQWTAGKYFKVFIVEADICE